MTTSGRPADCPRLVDGGVGPRVCWHEDDCTYHNLYQVRLGVTSRGASRAAVAIDLGDECSLDAADRTKLEGEPMALTKVALRLGVSKQRASTLSDLAIRKLAKAMGASDRKIVFRALMAWLRRG
jgi:hypothetical protein